ncbi:MAG: TetR/AcrR family transcriptional regulator [Gammaproteobacteria bacterium]|nr:TetR/AcrR family transcriptional regulator [Gammaproteobacteria bacterium]
MDTAQTTSTREQILDSAWKRFAQYGYGKTTMVEIATDCDMSAANLYRFFKNKEDIGMALACQCLGQKEKRLREVLTRPGLSAAQRLHTFVLTLFHYTYEQFHDQPRINELVDTIMKEYADVVMQHKEMARSLLATILTEGNQTGEFNIPNPIVTADTLMAATTIFCVPYFVTWHSKEEFESLAQDMVNTFIRGLAKR